MLRHLSPNTTPLLLCCFQQVVFFLHLWPWCSDKEIDDGLRYLLLYQWMTTSVLLLTSMKVKIQKIQAPNTRGYFKIDGRWHAERRKNACLAWNFSDSSLLPSSLLWKYGFFNRLWNFGRKLRLWYKNFKNRDQATNKKGNFEIKWPSCCYL